MARQDMTDRTLGLQRRIERVDGSTRHAKGAGDAFLFENENCCVDRAHPGHVSLHGIVDGRECQRAYYFSIFSEYFFISKKRPLSPDFIGFFVFHEIRVANW